MKNYYGYKFGELWGAITPEILRYICMGGDCREANIRTVLVKVIR